MARRNLRALLRLIDEHPRVIRVTETAAGVDIQLSPAAQYAPAPPPAAKDEPEEPTPDEWLRAQYAQPDGT